jgi:hypothetical protein
MLKLMMNKITLIFYLNFIVLFSAQASGVHSVFIKLDKQQTLVDLRDYKIVPSGNFGVKEIPEIAKMKFYTRAVLSGEWFALLHAGNETKFSRVVGEGKIPSIMERLREEGILEEIKKVSRAFDIHPLHILGPIIGENTFNGAIDSTIQDGLLNLITETDYQDMSKKMDFIINSKEVQKCFTLSIRNYWKWRCILANSKGFGKPSNRGFVKWLYKASKKGTGTFGIGQAQPFVLWGFNDVVVEKQKDFGKAVKDYHVNDLKTPIRHTQNDKLMISYIAAIAKQAIDTYKIMSGVDISQNPGLTTTLYNVGDIHLRAHFFKASGREYPSVNYMGWFVNDFSDLIMSYY